MFNDLLHGNPPLDNIDLILVTHEHPDHYDAYMVELVLSKQKRAVFIAPPNAVELLKIAGPDVYEEAEHKRIKKVDLQIGDVVELLENGIDIKIFGLKHGGPSNMMNFAFLVKIDDRTFFHKGDSVVDDTFFQSNRLEEENIDILFTQEYGEGLNNILKYTKPKEIIYMHILPKNFNQISREVHEKHPDVIIFKNPMETIVFD